MLIETVSAGGTEGGAQVSGGTLRGLGLISSATIFSGAQSVGPGGTAIAFQLLMFPSTDLAGTFASMEKFAVGYFMDKRTIEWKK